MGLDVKSISEETHGISDNQVIAIAQEEKRIILTFDSDYGKIIYRYGLENPPPVVYFRDKGLDPLFAGQMMKYLINSTDISLEGTFTVIESNNIRQRKY